MANLIAFESSWKIADERENVRKARKHVIEKAKAVFEREERKKDEAHQKGEDRWMLPSVSGRIEQDPDKSNSKKKKKEKKKKEKRKKKKRTTSGSSCSDSDSEEQAEPKWVEKSAPQNKTKRPVQGPQLQRDSWMVEPPEGGLLPVVSRDELRAKTNKQAEEKKQEQTILDTAGKHSKELNPYWKDGGSGLPDQEKTQKASAGKVAGDGGIGWLKKAIERCEEQAAERGVSVEEVAVERYGSGDYLHNRLREAEENLMLAQREQQTKHHDRPSHHLYRDKPYNRYKHSRDDSSEQHRPPKDSKRQELSRSSSSSSSGSDSSSHSKNGRHKSSGHTNRNERNSCDRSQSRDRNRSKRHRSRSRERTDRNGSRYTYSKRNRSRSRDRSRSREKTRKDNRSEEYSDRHRYDRESRSDRYWGSNRERTRDSSRDRSFKLGLKSLSGKFKRPNQSSDSENEKSSSYSSHRDRRKDTSSSGWRKKGVMNAQHNNKDSREESHSKKRTFVPPPDSDSEPTAVTSRSAKSGSSWRKKSPEKLEKKKQESSGSSVSSSSDSEREQAEVKQETAIVILSEQQMNQLGAKIVRAEIMGNQALAEKLKAQLDAARQAKEEAPKHIKQGAEQTSASKKEAEEVVLTRTDRKGMVRPVAEQEEAFIGSSSGKKRRKQKKAKTHTGSKGDRERYFADDDNYDLKTLVRQEKLGTAETHDEMFLRLAGKQADKATDDWHVDDMFVERAANQQSDGMKEQRDTALAIMEHKKITAAMEKCTRCFDKLPKHLIIAIGIKVCLVLPNHRSLTDGHCMIVPMQHVSQATSVDEDVWDEIQVFRKGLTKMFEEQGEDCVFMEICKNLKHHPHMYMDCVPIPKETGDMAPMYFKKAIMESESEWAQNKKVVDLAAKGIRHAVPKGFPYFSVDFGLQSGFAHVIEDEQTFPGYFGREVVGGMIDAGPELWRKPHKEDFEQQRQKVLKFAEWWKPYDWTQRLKSKREDCNSD